MDAKPGSGHTLVRHPRPAPNESLQAYLLRVSSLNGYPTPSGLLRLAGLDAAGAVKKIDCRALSGVLRCDASELSRIACRPNTKRRGGMRLNGHDLSSKDIVLGSTAICVKCVEDLGYIEAHWHLRQMIACPTHRERALVACEACNKPLTWKRMGLADCSCGASLVVNDGPPLDEKVLQLLSLIRSKALYSRLSEIESDLPIAALTGMRLRSLLVLIRVLGTQMLAVSDLPRSDMESILAAAFDVLSDWPLGFHSLLGRIRNAQGKSGAGGARSFRGLTAALFVRTDKQSAREFRFVKTALADFLLKQDQDGFVSPKLRAFRSDGDADLITRSELSRRLGVGPNLTARLLESRKISTKTVAAGSQRHILVSAGETQRLTFVSERILGARAAAKRLGISRDVLSRLKDFGIYRSQALSWRNQGFSEADLKAFAVSLLSSMRRVWSLPAYRKLSMRWILSRQLHSESDFVNFFHALKHRRISIVGASDETVGGLEIDRQSFEHLLFDTQTSGWMSISATAQFLTCDTHAVRGLLNTAQLQLHSTEPNGVCRASAAQFKERFIPLATIASEYGTSSRALMRLCDDFSILPLVVASGKRPPQAFIPVQAVDLFSHTLDQRRDGLRVGAERS